MNDADATVRRVERSAWYACGAMAVLALALARGRPGPAVAVLAGGALIGIAYWSLKSGVGGLLGDTPSGRGTRGTALLKVAGRYALLGFLAYVMIARLRLHPIGLLVGASSVAAAAFVEAGRFLVKKTS